MRLMILIAVSIGVLCSITCSAESSFDVRTYGAKCDGSTNDYNAITAAINAAKTAGGGVVTGPSAGGAPCVTSSNQSIDIPANVWLSGFSIGTASGQSMTVNMLSTNGGSLTCPSTLISGVRIKNMTLDGGASTTISGASAISLNCVTQSLVTENTIRRFGWEGVVFNYSTNSLLKDNEFQSIYGDCADTQGAGADGIQIISNVCDAQGHATDGGFSANVNSSNITIANNVVKGLAAPAFGIESAGAHDVLIAGNAVEGGYGLGNGIRVLYNLVDSYDVTISNNIVGVPPSGGFCINVTNPNSTHQKNPIKITDNQCIGNSSSSGGIYVNGYSVDISSNAIRIPNTGASCILLDANANVPAGYMTVHDNILSGCGTAVQGGTSAYFAQPMYFGSELVVH